MNRFIDLKTAAAAALAVAAIAGCAPNANSGSNASPSPSPSAAPASAAPRNTALPAAGGTAIVQVTPTPYPANAATPQIVVTASPLAPPVSAPVSAPPIRPAASATPAATATPAETVLELPPNAPPHILKVEISKTDVHGGDVVSGFVQTSSNVASVELRVAGFSLSMPKSSAGRFALSYTVPSVPFFLRKTYPMEIIARNTRGDAARTSIPITIH